MKNILISFLCLGSMSSVWGADPSMASATPVQKNSYCFGVNLGNSWKNQEIEVDTEYLLRGLKDAKTGAPLAFSQEEIAQLMDTLTKEVRSKQTEKRKVQGDKNKKLGDDFMAANKIKEGIVVLPSGLQYKVITAGKGESPNDNDSVSVNYRGTLLDGTEFDSSFKRGQPAKFQVNQVIKGWTEALKLMKVGSKWQLFIPSDIAYGERGMGARIEPNSALIFEVELLGVERAAPAAASQPVTSDIIKVPSAEEMKKGAQIEVIKKEDLEKMQSTNKAKVN